MDSGLSARGCRSWAAVMRNPVIKCCRPRLTVSTSGSSGMTLRVLGELPSSTA